MGPKLECDGRKIGTFWRDAYGFGTRVLRMQKQEAKLVEGKWLKIQWYGVTVKNSVSNANSLKSELPYRYDVNE